jgi:hypothetical protein
MTKHHIKAVLDRVSSWPQERQQELAELALEIEAEMSDRPYEASVEELRAIDEALAGETADEADVEAAFAVLRREK